MSNEEQILSTLQKLLETQEQTLAIQKQAFDSQQKAIVSQQVAIENQLATGRIYRIVVSVLAVFLVLFVYLLFRTWH